MPISASALASLQKQSAEVLQTLMVDTFRYRHEGVSIAKKTQWASLLSTQVKVNEEQLDELALALHQLLHQALYLGLEPSDLSSLFPREVDNELRSSLSKVIATHLADWRKTVLANQVSPAHLVDFDWRVDVKTSSNYLSRMQVPTVLVEMKLQDMPSKQGIMPPVRNVQFELSKETLATMLDGLGKIRDQLGSVK